jgi:E3 ubiquitin-protein ligase MYCBP2
LGQAPCIVLDCGGGDEQGALLRHVFHYACVQTKLRSGWNGAAIDFAFLKCPLCEARINHPACAALLAPQLQLEDKVRNKALARLKFEGLEQDKAIVERGGRFYGSPAAFALHHFAFYQCYLCRQPYFAGARACGAEAADAAPVRREDLTCAGCQQVQNIDKCAKHGNDWLSFKCRFCCKVAIWHCFGKVHFCDYHHSRYSTFCESSGKNLKRYYEYDSCPSLKSNLTELLKDLQGKTPAEQDEHMAKLTSDPTDCPLGVRHPPHGIEFGMGCGVCREELLKSAGTNV